MMDGDTKFLSMLRTVSLRKRALAREGMDDDSQRYYSMHSIYCTHTVYIRESTRMHIMHTTSSMHNIIRARRSGMLL